MVSYTWTRSSSSQARLSETHLFADEVHLGCFLQWMVFFLSVTFWTLHETGLPVSPDGGTPMQYLLTSYHF